MTIASVAGAMLVTICAVAFGNPSPPNRQTAALRSDSSSESIVSETPVSRDTPPLPPLLPEGRAIARLNRGQCLFALRRYAVSFTTLEAGSAPGVEIPIRLDGPLGGITISSRSSAEINRVLDCRLALGILLWAPTLRAANIVRVEHISIYRPGARVAQNGAMSGHSRALAIDVSHFYREDGSVLEVEALWAGAIRRADPCLHPEDESEDLRSLRDSICSAGEQEIFQLILTPHYDAAHRNHVHLELRGEVDWSYVH